MGDNLFMIKNIPYLYQTLYIGFILCFMEVFFKFILKYLQTTRKYDMCHSKLYHKYFSHNLLWKYICTKKIIRRINITGVNDDKIIVQLQYMSLEITTEDKSVENSHNVSILFETSKQHSKRDKKKVKIY